MKRPSTADLLTINAINGGWNHSKGDPSWWTRHDLNVGVIQTIGHPYALAYKTDGAPTNVNRFEEHDNLAEALLRAVEVSS